MEARERLAEKAWNASSGGILWSGTHIEERNRWKAYLGRVLKTLHLSDAAALALMDGEGVVVPKEPAREMTNAWQEAEHVSWLARRLLTTRSSTARQHTPPCSPPPHTRRIQMTPDEIAERRRVVTVKLLEWTPPTEPNGDCAYDHCIAQTEFGRIFLDWKSWKGREDGDGTDAGVSIYAQWDFDDGWIGCEYSLDAAKAKAQSFYENRILSALTLVSRALPADRCEDCPPSGCPTDATRCDPCDRRALTVEEMPSAWQQRLKGRWHNLPEDWSKEECDRMPPGKVFRPLYAPDQLTRLCDQAKREAYAECLACQPSTAENPNEDAYQRGRFDGVMEFARNIVAKKALAEKKP